MGAASSSDLGDRVADRALGMVNALIRCHTPGKKYGKDDGIYRKVYIHSCDQGEYSEKYFRKAAVDAQNKVNNSNSMFNVEINPFFKTEDGKKVVNYYMDIYVKLNLG